MKKSELVKLLQGVSKENIETAILHAGLTLDANFFSDNESRAIIRELVKTMIHHQPFLNVYIDVGESLIPAKITEVFFSPETSIEDLTKSLVEHSLLKLVFSFKNSAIGSFALAAIFCVPESDILMAIKKANLPIDAPCYKEDDINAIREILIESGWDQAKGRREEAKMILAACCVRQLMIFTLADIIDIFSMPASSVLKAIQQANLPVDAPFYQNDDFELIRSKLVNY